jgi:hypothetical protein
MLSILRVASALVSLEVARAAAPNASTCGPASPSKVADCDKPDMGAGGNACCVLELNMTGSPTKTYNGLKDWLGQGGSDTSYAYTTGPDAAGNNVSVHRPRPAAAAPATSCLLPSGSETTARDLQPGDDLRKYDIEWQYIFQGKHVTKGGYVDTLNFNIKKGPEAGTFLRVASISNIHGALGDDGQNFKTLVYMLREMHPDWETHPIRIVHGCGQGD